MPTCRHSVGIMSACVGVMSALRRHFPGPMSARQDDGQLPHIEHALFLMGGVPLSAGDAIASQTTSVSSKRDLKTDRTQPGFSSTIIPR
jgi:hypothetical protein